MTIAASDPIPITPNQRASERALVLAISLDCTMLFSFTVIGLLGGSLTIIAETIRGGLGILLEFFSLHVMRQIHRGTLADLEFGTGKLEQVAKVSIGASTIAGAMWVTLKAFALTSGEESIGTPFGLALAAIVGVINLYVNVLAWVAAYHAARRDTSILMKTQVSSRVVKLLCSLFIGLTLTVAAISMDETVAVTADVIGALFVAVYSFYRGVVILRSSLPDLIDRSAGKDVQAAILQAINDHRGDDVALNGFRTRRSGHVTFIEISLGFDSGLTLAELDRRASALKAALQKRIQTAEISILMAPRAT